MVPYLVSIDTETGGLDPFHNPLLSVGGVIFENGSFEVVSSLELFIKPDPPMEITSEARSKNQISDYHINEFGVDEYTVLSQFSGWLGKFIPIDRGYWQAMLLGWNYHFDHLFLRVAYHRCGLPWDLDFRVLDVQSLQAYQYGIIDKQWPYPGLERTALSMLKHKVEHGAMDDALVVGHLLKKFSE